MEAVNILRGEVGSKVTLTLYRRGRKEIKVTLTRAAIKIERVKGLEWNRETSTWDYFVDDQDKIAYLRLAAFQEGTPEDLEKVVTELPDEGMQALVLDLRFNHGGLYPSAIDVTDLFISEGVIVSTRGRTHAGETRSAEQKGTLPDFALAVLINDASASASEIVAGAIKDHKRGILIGSRSFGKGSVQNIIPIEGTEAALKLTTQRWYTPSGTCVVGDESQKPGLAPDLEVPLSDEEVIGLRESWRQQAYGPLKEPLETEEAPEGEPPAKLPPETPEAKPFVDRQLERAVTYLRDVLLDRQLRAAN
jgi:carboxyl-terminal processing protease